MAEHNVNRIGIGGLDDVFGLDEEDAGDGPAFLRIRMSSNTSYLGIADGS